tara:strand:+ start:1865 stop:2989 length:1125 start_codon:yes stop_codon:yes gene_type:complete
MPVRATNPTPNGAAPVPSSRQERKRLSKASNYPFAKPPNRKPDFQITAITDYALKAGVPLSDSLVKMLAVADITGKYGPPFEIGKYARWTAGPVRGADGYFGFFKADGAWQELSGTQDVTALYPELGDAGAEDGQHIFSNSGERLVAWFDTLNYSAVAVRTLPQEKNRGEVACLYIGKTGYAAVIEKDGRQIRQLSQSEAEERMCWVVTGRASRVRQGFASKNDVRVQILGADGRPGSSDPWRVGYYRAVAGLTQGEQVGRASVIGLSYDLNDTVAYWNGWRQFPLTSQNVVKGWTTETNEKILFAGGTPSQYLGQGDTAPMIPYPLEAAPMIRAVVDKEYLDVPTSLDFVASVVGQAGQSNQVSDFLRALNNV